MLKPSLPLSHGRSVVASVVLSGYQHVAVVDARVVVEVAAIALPIQMKMAAETQ